jgi:hypothetical protein
VYGLPADEVGVPEIEQVAPITELQPDKPGGKEPLETVQVIVPVKLLPVRVCVPYAVPTGPFGSVVGVIVGELPTLNAPEVLEKKIVLSAVVTVNGEPDTATPPLVTA